MMTLIGMAIKKRRREAGLTSADLAHRVGKTPQYVRLIECGGATPSVETMLSIANQFSDVDSGEWLWLLLDGIYGFDTADLLWSYARRVEHRPFDTWHAAGCCSDPDAHRQAAASGGVGEEA